MALGLLEDLLPLLQYLAADLRVRHLAAPEHHRHFHLVPLLQQALHQRYLSLHVGSADSRAHPHLMDHAALVVLAGVAVFLRLLVLPLAIVQYPADGRRAVRVDLYEVKAALSGDVHGLLGGNHTVVLPARPDKSNLWDPDPVIYPKQSDYARPLSKVSPRQLVENIAHHGNSINATGAPAATSRTQLVGPPGRGGHPRSRPAGRATRCSSSSPR